MTEEIKSKTISEGISNETVELNWDGNGTTNKTKYVHIIPDAYDATFDHIEIQEVKKFKSEEKIKKFLIFWKIGNDVFPYFAVPKISKTNNPEFNNSKLYDFLEKLQLIDSAKQSLGTKSTIETIQLFLSQTLSGKKARISIIDAGKKTEPYSIVEKVIRPL